SEHPVAFVIMVGLVCAMVDIGSYFVGRGFGSRPLAPTLSPNKTVEGFIGGVVFGVMTAAVLSTLPPYEEVGFTGSLILGAVVSLVGPLGDLAESMVKRSLGVKDMGSVLPGHGGMLDRIDSFLFAVPAAYVLFLIRGLLCSDEPGRGARRHGLDREPGARCGLPSRLVGGRPRRHPPQPSACRSRPS